MENIEFYKKILDKESIEYYYKIKTYISEYELYCLIIDLKNAIEKLEKENRKYEMNLLVNKFMYTFNCLLLRKNQELIDDFGKIQDILGIERDSLVVINELLSSKELSNKLISKIYLNLLALSVIGENVAIDCNNMLKQDKFENKGVYYYPGREINLEEKEENIQKIYQYVKELKK